MLTFEEALTMVLDSARPLAGEQVDLDRAANRVLAENVVSDIDIPPFDKSMRDGYACRREDLANALRHTPADGSVVVDLKTVGNIVQWRVTDTGEGVLPEDIPGIFDRFYRADGSRSRQTGGTGLGLTIVKQIITAHHGKISVASPPPSASLGTQFTILLPVEQ